MKKDETLSFPYAIKYSNFSLWLAVFIAILAVALILLWTENLVEVVFLLILGIGGAGYFLAFYMITRNETCLLLLENQLIYTSKSPFKKERAEIFYQDILNFNLQPGNGRGSAAYLTVQIKNFEKYEHLELES